MVKATPDWHPAATQGTLLLRAALLKKIRTFFEARDVLEVETPLLMQATNPDPHIHSFRTRYRNQTLYLQTSPEFAMKRLLASGSGSIYQVCKAFRDDESGRYHNPEFTMLEWYRIDFDHHELMQETYDLIETLWPEASKPIFITYYEAFKKYAGIDPYDAPQDLSAHCQTLGIQYKHAPNEDIDTLRDLLMSHIVQPALSKEGTVFLYDYPASQAALACIDEARTPPVAERFELFINGVELANGWRELSNAATQRKRFLAQLELRRQQELPELPLDENFLAALPELPPCSGVAMGLDRLLMLKASTNKIGDILSFPIDHA